jgi:hypothetical protein
MKNLIFFISIVALIISCKSKPLDSNLNEQANAKVINGDTVKIANEETEYEVIIIDAGFSNWLNGRALPRGYHSENFLENKNRFYVQEWNSRVLQPFRYNPNLYMMSIDYDPSIHYGYEVNYLIYNYMIYFQNTYNQKLWGFVPIR